MLIIVCKLTEDVHMIWKQYALTTRHSDRRRPVVWLKNKVYRWLVTRPDSGSDMTRARTWLGAGMDSLIRTYHSPFWPTKTCGLTEKKKVYRWLVTRPDSDSDMTRARTLLGEWIHSQYLPGEKQPHNFMEKAKVVMYWSRLPHFGSSHQFESRSFQWQFRRLTWTNLFVWFLLLSPDEIMWLFARLHISTREVL